MHRRSSACPTGSASTTAVAASEAASAAATAALTEAMSAALTGPTGQQRDQRRFRRGVGGRGRIVGRGGKCRDSRAIVGKCSVIGGLRRILVRRRRPDGRLGGSLGSLAAVAAAAVMV